MVRALTWILVASAVAIIVGEALVRMRVPHVVLHDPESLSEWFEIGGHLLIDYTERGRKYRPNAHVTIRNEELSGRDIDVRIGSHGFRDRELGAARRPGELRILVIGDSITAGDYLRADEVYVERIEAHLAELHPEGPVEVINAGLGNLGLREEIAILEDRGLDLRPDWLLVGFYLNDVEPPWGFAGSVADRSWIRSHSLLADTLYTLWMQYLWSRTRPEGLFAWTGSQHRLDWKTDPRAFARLVEDARGDWGASWRPNATKVVADAFDRLAELAAANDFGVAIAVFPVKFQVLADHVDRSPQRMLEAEARARGFSFLDLLPLLREHRDEALFFDHCHLVPSANELVGARIAAFLQREIGAARAAR